MITFIIPCQAPVLKRNKVCIMNTVFMIPGIMNTVFIILTLILGYRKAAQS